jgi:hypothetical protein
MVRGLRRMVVMRVMGDRVSVEGVEERPAGSAMRYWGMNKQSAGAMHGMSGKVEMVWEGWIRADEDSWVRFERRKTTWNECLVRISFAYVQYPNVSPRIFILRPLT